MARVTTSLQNLNRERSASKITNAFRDVAVKEFVRKPHKLVKVWLLSTLHAIQIRGVNLAVA